MMILRGGCESSRAAECGKATLGGGWLTSPTCRSARAASPLPCRCGQPLRRTVRDRSPAASP